jgi:hypothetical protein
MKRPSLWDRQRYGLENEQRAPHPAPQTELDRLRAKVEAALARANPHERLETSVASG